MYRPFHTLRRLILMLATLLLGALPVATAFGAPGEQSQQGDEQLVINQIEARGWPEITLNLTLTGPDGKAVPGVEAARFEVREENQPQAIAGLALGTARTVPVSLAMVIDISDSMNATNKLGQAKEAAIAFLASLRPEDSASVLAFNNVVRVVVPSTNDRAALALGINALQATGNTAAYDALHRAAQVVSAAKPGVRRVIVLLTDGADTGSRYSAGVATEVARASGALVYTIGLGPDAKDSILTSLSAPSGGKYYKAPAPADLQGIYTAISLELSSQFLLKYNSATQVDRPYKLVTVQLKYVSPSGQLIVKSLRYRPSVAALLPGTAEVSVAPTQLPQPNVPPPAGVLKPPAQPSGIGFVPSNPNMLSAFGALAAGLCILLLSVAVAARFSPTLVGQRLARYTGQLPTTPIEEEERAPGFGTRVAAPFVKGLGRRIAKLTPRGYTDHIQQLLALSGPPYRMQLADFVGIQFGLTVLLTAPLVWWAASAAPKAPAQWVLLGSLGLILGIYLPYTWLARKVRSRQKALLRSLPGSLDFLAINVEAGMGFDAAMTEVVRRWRNALTDEFSLLLIDFQIGKPRKDAWRDLIQRTQVPDLNAFVTAMLQNEQVGSSIGSLLRTQADHMRVRRRQRAETAARIAPVKMLLPLVFFVFPGILVVLLGPSIPQFIDAFSKLGR